MVSESHSSFDKSVRNEKTGQLFHEPMSKKSVVLGALFITSYHNSQFEGREILLKANENSK